MSNKGYKALQTALRVLAYQAYSEQELRQKLGKRGYAAELITEVIDYLTKRGYLNDTALGSALFAKYFQSGKYGLRNIMYKLRQRGLPEHVIRSEAANYAGKDEVEKALALACKKYKSLQQVERQKIGRYLAAKGFSVATITKLFERLEHSWSEGF